MIESLIGNGPNREAGSQVGRYSRMIQRCLRSVSCWQWWSSVSCSVTGTKWLTWAWGKRHLPHRLLQANLSFEIGSCGIPHMHALDFVWWRLPFSSAGPGCDSCSLQREQHSQLDKISNSWREWMYGWAINAMLVCKSWGVVRDWGWGRNMGRYCWSTWFWVCMVLGY